MKKKVFITGGSGCVGHYVFDLLIANNDYHLYLLVRNPQKLKFNPSSYTNLTLISDDLKNIEKHAALLKDMDYVIHIAAGWGETETNDEYTLNFFRFLDPSKCKKVIYFSTASILGSDNKVFDRAEEIGTSYIRGKYLCYKKLPELKIHDRIITLFPTWVLGGDSQHPYSHATLGIKQSIKWLWLLRFLSVDVSFHFIHAQDIALMVDYLLKNETQEKEIVLGNPLIDAEQFVKEMCDYFKQRVYFKVKISPALVIAIDSIFGKKLSAWDKYCLEKKHFEYKVKNTKNFGIKSNYSTVADIVGGL